MRSAGGGDRNALPWLSVRARAAEEFCFRRRAALWPLSARARPPERARRGDMGGNLKCRFLLACLACVRVGRRIFGAQRRGARWRAYR